jgi:hypothetical protein
MLLYFQECLQLIPLLQLLMVRFNRVFLSYHFLVVPHNRGRGKHTILQEGRTNTRIYQILPTDAEII